MCTKHFVLTIGTWFFSRHAGVWTVEEATRMCRDKMIRLRSLYITQFKRLQHVLKERRRKYCQAIQAEEVEETGKQTWNVIHLSHQSQLAMTPETQVSTRDLWSSKCYVYLIIDKAAIAVVSKQAGDSRSSTSYLIVCCRLLWSYAKSSRLIPMAKRGKEKVQYIWANILYLPFNFTVVLRRGDQSTVFCIA